ncbi:MAG: type I-G CRISPR-associated helicase/endonuclease Cas3g [Planctomycetota bacterium]
MAKSESSQEQRFSALFQQATNGCEPLPYQKRLALVGGTVPYLLNVPTGLGKTAAAVLAWIWRRRFAEGNVRYKTPRRLVYCLPMRVLVEQTYGETVRWLERLDLLATDASADNGQKGETTIWAAQHGDHGRRRIAVHLLMGGEERTDWAFWPERDAVLIGTQDMLLSRALNRGYAARRPRWPIEFGLLNNDCLWVFDEVQLMGPGLATGLQLEAFRHTEVDGRKYFGTEPPCVSWYMSATASRKLLRSREWRKDGSDKRPKEFVFELSAEEKNETEGILGQRRLATKHLECGSCWSINDEEAAQRILARHQQMLQALTAAPLEIPRRTLIICNTVDRARNVHASLAGPLGEDAEKVLVLLHSCFRPPDRVRQQDRLKAKLDIQKGQIVVATQVVEAGVDLSSAILWTDVAPLPSIVQRLGRLNRTGEFGHGGGSHHGWTPVAVLLGVPLPAPPAKQTKEAREKHERETTQAYLPYDRSECESAAQALQNVPDASPANLETELRSALDSVLHLPDCSLQRHELLDFFDTDSNLSLGYTDVSPFVRGLDPETDIYVLWRDWEGDFPPYDFDVGRHEICPVRIWKVIGKKGLSTWDQGFVWQGPQREDEQRRRRGWQLASRANLLPGATLLLPTHAGGYDDTLGWTGIRGASVQIVDLYRPLSRPTDEDLLSSLERGWQSIESHTTDVQCCWNSIRQALALDDTELCAAIDKTILWHDYGKAVRRWQAATRVLAHKAGLAWPRDIGPIGKFSFSESPQLNGLSRAELYRAIRDLRRSFAPKLRHEVASALALRQHHRRDGRDPTLHELLAEYLVMAHHGHVRKALRDELPRDPRRIRRGREEVRGIRERTPVPGFAINGKPLPATESLSIACRQMGRSPDGSESWTRTVLRLLDHFGPFRLAYYEALVRAADCHASAEPKTNVVIASPRQLEETAVGAAQEELEQ